MRGRDEELKILCERLRGLAAGRGGVIVVEGPPGIGKSRLLRECVSGAGDGVRPLFGQCFAYQQAVPFAPLLMATPHSDRPVGDTRSAGDFGSGDSPSWVLHDLLQAVSAAAVVTPLEIVIDDIQWADNATLLALQLLTAKLADAPVLWVLAARTGAGGVVVGETISLLECEGALILRLGALAPRAVAEMVQDVVRATAEKSLLDLADKSHGNPFLVTELVEGLQEEGRIVVSGGRASVVGDTLPQRLTATMQQRLDRLASDTRRMVQVASVLPERFSAGLLAVMLERRPVGLISAVEEAVRADLLVEDGDRLRFRHDVLRQATRQSLPQSLLRAMERDAATTLLKSGAAPAEVAPQLARSAEVGDQAAIAALRRAAHSLAGCDPGTAADISNHALQLLPLQDRLRGPLVAETVVLLNQAMRYDEAQQLAAATLRSDLSPQEEAQVRLATASLTHLPGRRAEENRRALQLSNISDDIRTRHLAWLAYNLAVDGQDDELRQTAEQALAAARTSGDTASGLLAEVALANLVCAQGQAEDTKTRLDRIGELMHASQPGVIKLVAAANRANLMITVGSAEEAAAAVGEGLRRSRVNNNLMGLRLFTGLRALLELALGRLSAARAVVDSVPAAERMTWSRLGGQIGMIALSQIAAHTDDRVLLREVGIQARDARAHGGPAVRREALAALAHAAWQRGDVHQALRWLADDFPLLQTPLWMADLDHLILAARVAAGAGDASLRSRVMQAAATLRRDNLPVSLFFAVACHASAVLERDADGLLGAAKTLEGCSRPLLYAAAAEDAGRELARLQRCPEAVDQLNAAFDTYIDCQASADAYRVAHVLREHGVARRIVFPPRPKTGIGSLTDGELKVAHLVASGASNRVAAQQLFLSPHTVNTHLRNIFGKLDINSRAQLSLLLNGDG
ncbi:LuxR family transcriptional regulator [Mycobacterium sp. 1482292.6]|nr:LuxR family transcriptional regulator [Mycobacterium sp. 1482292.6]OBJ24492.1 LuxR family transcriptional regulator [Mycobacterium sp. 1245801.1]